MELGGTDGMDTAVDLVFTDSSSNSQSDWTGGAPAADYLPASVSFACSLQAKISTESGLY